MNIKEFYNKFDLSKEVRDFNFKKKQIKQMIDNAKKNGEDINKLCDFVLHALDIDFLDKEFIREKVIEIKNIVGGKINE